FSPNAEINKHLAEQFRLLEAACDDYAQMIEKAQRTYWEMALANFASFLYLSTFPWQAGAAYELTQFLMRRAAAGVLARLLEIGIVKAVLARFLEYSIGSVFYDVGDFLAVDLVKASFGDFGNPLDDPGGFLTKLGGSFKDNAKELFIDFVG